MASFIQRFLLGACLISIAAGAESELDRRISAIFGPKREFEAKTFGPARWLDDGAAYTTLENSPATKGAKEIVRYDAESGRREIAVSAAQLTPSKPGATPLTIDDYTWSRDGRHVLIFTNARKVWRQKTRGDYWVLDQRTGRLRQLGGKAPAATLMFAKFSPDGTRVAYVSQGNLFVETLDGGSVRQLTSDGSKHVTNGSPDWVNEEELRIRDAFRWSDDSRALAYWQFDTTRVQEFTMVNNTAGLYPETTTVPYPKAGTVNSAVRIGVVDVAGGKTRWMKLPGDPREHYVARLAWSKDRNELEIHQLNRRQNRLTVFLGDARTGDVRPWFEDNDAAWVSVREAVLRSRDGGSLLIPSERDGWLRGYAVARADGKVRAVTPAGVDAITLVGTDAREEWIYFTASPASATQRYLYRSRLDGTGAAERLSPADQPGTHSYTLSPDGRFALHTYARFHLPPVTRLIRLPSHDVVRTLEANAPLREKTATLLPAPEFFTVEAAPGAALDGWMMRPRNFDAARRYPVIVFIYGEGGSVRVTDNWEGTRGLFHQALADAGYVVLCLDNRGTPAPKGRDWRKACYGEGNAIAVRDQTAALKNLLAQRPYLDAARVGVWGHSGGGANTLNLMFRSPETYHVGVAAAPVTDVHYYDTIYQERYLGLPKENAAGYRAASSLPFAEGLRGRLLIIHGGADDNVHYQHTELLVNRLVELQKDFQLMVYPNGTHAISEGKGYHEHRHRLTARFFIDHLPSGARNPEAN